MPWFLYFKKFQRSVFSLPDEPAGFSDKSAGPRQLPLLSEHVSRGATFSPARPRLALLSVLPLSCLETLRPGQALPVAPGAQCQGTVMAASGPALCQLEGAVSACTWVFASVSEAPGQGQDTCTAPLAAPHPGSP